MKPLREFLEELQREASARPVEADGDWTTTATISSYDGQKTVLIIDPGFMSSVETKNRLAELYCQSLLRLRGVRLGVTEVVWAVARDADDPNRTPPADDPQRVEAARDHASGGRGRRRRGHRRRNLTDGAQLRHPRPGLRLDPRTAPLAHRDCRARAREVLQCAA